MSLSKTALFANLKISDMYKTQYTYGIIFNEITSQFALFCIIFMMYFLLKLQNERALLKTYFSYNVQQVLNSLYKYGITGLYLIGFIDYTGLYLLLTKMFCVLHVKIPEAYIGILHCEVA